MVLIRANLVHLQRKKLILAVLSGVVVLLSAVALVGFDVAAGAAMARQASARHGFLTGFLDEQAFQGPDPPQRLAAFQHASQARASVIRLAASWRGVAPNRPPSSGAARDPGWSGYNWGRTDTAVREARAAGFRILLSWTGTPDWAEGGGRPSSAFPGTWRPSASQYRLFAEAAARRYSGSYGGLPRVRYWQAWNEPNLNLFLAPQWRRVNGHLVPASPGIYAPLLNAFYSGVKSVHRSNVVVTAGTAPFGRNPGGPSVRPALFDRLLFCVRGRRHPRPVHCGTRVHFDVLAHHPYPFGDPRQTAGNLDDVNVPDLRKLTRPLRVAIRAGNVRPRSHKGLWATEISWDTKPPDPGGIPVRVQARYAQGALYTLWRQGVTVVTWFLLRDEPRGSGYGNTIQSGIYYRGSSVQNDVRKPAFYTFRFPFTAYTRRGVAQIWGLAPRRGRVTIQVRRHGHWRRLRRLRTHPGRLFLLRKRLARGTKLRARQGRSTSLVWRVGPRAIKK